MNNLKFKTSQEAYDRDMEELNWELELLEESIEDQPHYIQDELYLENILPLKIDSEYKIRCKHIIFPNEEKT